MGDTGVQPSPVDAMADAVLMRGERGKAVAALIRDLAVLGLYDGIQDDVFGHGTEAAVIDFQRANGLAADGYAGPVTLAAIADALAALQPVADVPPAPKPSGWRAWLKSLFN